MFILTRAGFTEKAVVRKPGRGTFLSFSRGRNSILSDIPGDPFFDIFRLHRIRLNPVNNCLNPDEFRSKPVTLRGEDQISYSERSLFIFLTEYRVGNKGEDHKRCPSEGIREEITWNTIWWRPASDTRRVSLAAPIPAWIAIPCSIVRFSI